MNQKIQEFLSHLLIFTSKFKPSEGSTDEFRVLGTTDNDQTPVEISIREVRLGTPSQIELVTQEYRYHLMILKFHRMLVSTKFTFESPVFLSGMKEYAFIIESNSTDYRVWISRLGEFDIGRDADDQVVVTKQTLLGTLFKSQNVSTWTPSQYEDCTFKLYRSDFVPSGSVQLFNPRLPTDLEVIPNNSLVIESNTIRVGLGTTVADSGLLVGQLITQDESGQLVDS